MNSCRFRRRRRGKYALEGTVQMRHFDIRISDVDVVEYLRDNDEDIISRLCEALRVHQSIKWHATMDIAFYRTTPDGEIQNTTGRFRTQPAISSDVCRPYDQRLSTCNRSFQPTRVAVEGRLHYLL